MRNIIYLILSIVTNTLFRFKPFDIQFGDPVENHTTYATGQALSYIFLLLICKSLFINKSVTFKLWHTAMFCAVSNLLDEIFFDPLHLGYNELAFAGFIIVWNIYRKVNYGESTE